MAINLPSKLKKQLFELSQGLRKFGQIKLVEEENIHLTLKFLGDSEPEGVITALDGIKLRQFDVSLNGVGVFPSLNYVRVVWVGCDKGAQEVVTLHDKIESSLNHFEKDKKFHPHATIARVRLPKDKEGLRKFVEKHAKDEFGGFKVESFDLMSSKLGRKGPEYAVVKEFLL